MHNDKPLPFNLDIECDVLGMLMLFDDNKELSKYISKISPDDFYRDINQKIFKTITELVYDDIIPDVVILSTKISEAPTYILELSNVVTNANIESKIKVLKDLSLRRKVIQSASEKIEEMYETPNSHQVIDDLIIDLSTVNGAYKPRKQFSTGDTIKEVAEMIKQTALGHSTQIVPYCIQAVDAKLTLLRKQIHVLGANSGIGKTAFVLSAMHQQMQNGVKTIIFCGESSRHELLERLISIRIDKPFMWITQGMQGATQQDINNFHEALKFFNDHSNNFVIYGKGDYEHSLIGISDVMQYETARLGQFDMIYVDYLQNMLAPKNTNTQEEKVSQNILGINNLIADYNAAGTVLSQINREAKFVKPYKEHLKYASTIENEAHVITFLHRLNDAKADSNGIKETEWYSDKTRVQQGIYTRLAFIERRAEYCGLYGVKYGNADVIECRTPYKN